MLSFALLQALANPWLQKLLRALSIPEQGVRRLAANMQPVAPMPVAKPSPGGALPKRSRRERRGAHQLWPSLHALADELLAGEQRPKGAQGGFGACFDACGDAATAARLSEAAKGGGRSARVSRIVLSVAGMS